MFGAANDPVPRYVINFDEFINLLGKDIAALISKAIKDKYPQITSNNIDLLLREIKDLLPDNYYKKLKNTLNIIIGMNELDATQKVEGRVLDIPPIIQSITETFKFDKDIYLTGLHFNQTGWKKDDTYTLDVNKLPIINKSSVKEIGEHKYLNTYYLVRANTPINFTLNNNSGNSRQTTIDLEYLEKINPPTPPGDPDFSDITSHSWDIGVKLLWEPDIDADIDIHAFRDGIETSYKYPTNHEGNNMWLDFDCQSHLVDKTRPEILTIKIGNNHNIVDIYITHFKDIDPPLTQPATVQVYKNNGDSYSMIKEFKVTLNPSDNHYLVGVCSIDLSNLDNISILNNKKQKAE